MVLPIKIIVQKLLFSLDALSHEHEEIMDTDVREALHLTLNHHFIWGNKFIKEPISYGMFSKKGDESVSIIMKEFFSSIESETLNDFAIGGERLNIIQDESITTPGGFQYDEFFGHVDEPLPLSELPEYLFENFDYDV